MNSWIEWCIRDNDGPFKSEATYGSDFRKVVTAIQDRAETLGWQFRLQNPELLHAVANIRPGTLQLLANLIEQVGPAADRAGDLTEVTVTIALEGNDARLALLITDAWDVVSLRNGLLDKENVEPEIGLHFHRPPDAPYREYAIVLRNLFRARAPSLSGLKKLIEETSPISAASHQKLYFVERAYMIEPRFAENPDYSGLFTSGFAIHNRGLPRAILCTVDERTRQGLGHCLQPTFQTRTWAARSVSWGNFDAPPNASSVPRILIFDIAGWQHFLDGCAEAGGVLSNVAARKKTSQWKIAVVADGEEQAFDAAQFADVDLVIPMMHGISDFQLKMLKLASELLREAQVAEEIVVAIKPDLCPAPQAEPKEEVGGGEPPSKYNNLKAPLNRVRRSFWTSIKQQHLSAQPESHVSPKALELLHDLLRVIMRDHISGLKARQNQQLFRISRMGGAEKANAEIKRLSQASFLADRGSRSRDTLIKAVRDYHTATYKVTKKSVANRMRVSEGALHNQLKRASSLSFKTVMGHYHIALLLELSRRPTVSKTDLCKALGLTQRETLQRVRRLGFTFEDGRLYQTRTVQNGGG